MTFLAYAIHLRGGKLNENWVKEYVGVWECWRAALSEGFPSRVVFRFRCGPEHKGFGLGRERKNGTVRTTHQSINGLPR
jgi:hypothetical protein